MSTPHTWQSLKGNGNEFFKLGSYEQSIACYEESLRLGPDSAGKVAILGNKSLVEMKLESYTKACQSAMELLNIDPKSVKGYFRLAGALKACKSFDLAEQVADLGLRLAEQPNDKKDFEAILKQVDTRVHPGANLFPSSSMATVEANIPKMMKGWRQAVDSVCSIKSHPPASDDGDSADEYDSARMESGSETSTSKEEEEKSMEDIAMDLRTRGTDLYKAGNYSGAIENYSEALELCPNNVAILGNRSAALLMTKKYEAARKDCLKLLELDRSYSKAYPRLAKASLGLGDVDKAISYAREGFTHEPGAQQLKTDLAKYMAVKSTIQDSKKFMATGSMLNALSACQRANSFFPEVFIKPLHAIICEAQLGLKRWDAALSSTRALLSHEQDSTSLHLHGQALVATGNMARAVAVYEQLYRQDPDNTMIAKALKRVRAMNSGRENGNAAFKNSNFTEAYEQYSRSLDADPTLRNMFTAQVATNRANVCIKQRRYAHAIDDANQAIEGNDTFAKAYLRRAQAHMELEDFDAAVRDFTKAGELDSNMPGISDMISKAKRELKKSKRVDYYKMLDISKDAGDVDVKKAYKRAALKCHPDKVAAEDRVAAEAKFKVLGEANSVLTDSQKRAKYDAGWNLEEIEQGYQENEGPGGCRGHHQHDMDDMFFSMFSGVHSGQHRHGFM